MNPDRARYLAKKYKEPLAVILALLGLYLASFLSFLLFFSFVKALIILLSFSIFVFVWNTRRLQEDLFHLVIGYGSLSTAILYLFHSLSDGISMFPQFGVQQSPRLLLASMVVQSSSLLAASFFRGRKGSPVKTGTVFAAVTALMLCAAFLSKLPLSYTADGRPTIFLHAGGIGVALISLAAVINLLRQDRIFRDSLYALFIAALAASAAAALLFAYDEIGISPSDFIRHSVRLLSWYLLYRAVIHSALDEPFARQNSNLRKKEEELRESEGRFRAIYERSPVGIAQLDALSGRFLQVNPKYAEITGYDPQELRSLTFQDITHTDYRQASRDSIDRLLKNDIRYLNMEERAVRKDGSVVWVHLTIVPMGEELAAEEGSARQYLAMVEDITARKRAEHALRLSERKYRDLFEHASDAIFIVDGEYRYRDVNRKAMELLGFTREELLDMRLFDGTPPDLSARSREMLRKLETEGNDETFTGKLSTKDGRLIDVEMSSSAIEAEGEVIGSRVIVRDVTERTRREEERRVEDRRLQSLLTITEHQTSSLQELLDLALEGVVALSDSRLGYIYYYSEEKEEFTLHAWSKSVMDSCTIADPATVYQLAKTGIWGEAVRQRRPLVINDFTAPHPLKKGCPEGHSPLFRFMTLPVIVRQRIVAVVGVANKADLYSDIDVRQLRLMMDSIWTIAERKIAEQSMRKERDRAQGYLDTVDTIIVALNAEGRIITINRKGCQLFGWSEEELIGRLWFATCLPQPEGAQKVYPVFLRLMTGEIGPSEYFENSIVIRSGELRKIAWHNALLHDEQGRIIGTLSSGEDITERYHAELEREVMLKTVDRLRVVAEQRADELAAILSTLMEPVVIYNVSGEIIHANQAVYSRRGFDPFFFDTTRNKTVLQMKTRDGVMLAPDQQPTARALNGETIVSEPFIICDILGRDIIGHVSASPFSSNGVLLGAIVAWHDITELERTKTSLQQAHDELEMRVLERTADLASANRLLQLEIENRALAEEELLRSRQQLRELSLHLQTVLEQERENIAREIHDELGQSLTAIKLDLSWLKDKYADQGGLLKKIDSMVGLIDMSITSVKRIASELRPAILDHLGLSAAVEWQVKEFIARTGITCRLDILPDDLTTDRDRSTALFRILQEALTNVIRHAEASEVRVSLKKAAGTITLQIEDNGKGITQEQLADHQAFGLMGIRERVLFLNGEVEIHSRALTGGTSMTIRIPLDGTAPAS